MKGDRMGIFEKIKTALANKLSDFVANNADKTDDSNKTNNEEKVDNAVKKIKNKREEINPIFEELKKCQEYAVQGYNLANKQYNKLLDTLKTEENRIRTANAEQNQMSRVKNTELIEQQQKGLNALTNYIYKIRDDIKMLRERQKDFSIVVYGRTMAGKSTLMKKAKKPRRREICIFRLVQHTWTVHLEGFPERP